MKVKKFQDFGKMSKILAATRCNSKKLRRSAKIQDFSTDALKINKYRNFGQRISFLSVIQRIWEFYNILAKNSKFPAVMQCKSKKSNILARKPRIWQWRNVIQEILRLWQDIQDFVGYSMYLRKFEDVGKKPNFPHWCIILQKNYKILAKSPIFNIDAGKFKNFRDFGSILIF